MNGPEQQAGPGQQTDAGQPVDGTQAANSGQPTSVEQSAGQPVTYEAASARVEEIIRRLDSGEASLDETLELLSEGKSLIELCAQQLTAVGGALEELRLDDLVSRLEREAGA
jgi:exodeoxyribonuclease VII small subunit